MRPSIVSMLIACLIGAGASTAIAQESSPPPWFGGRIELPDHGFAWTLPEGWVGFDLMADIDPQLGAILASSDSVDGSAEAMLRRELEQARDGGAQLFARDLEARWCTVSVVPSDLSIDEVETAFTPILADNDRFVDVVGPDRRELPAGPAAVVQWSSPVDSDNDPFWDMTGYFITGGLQLGWLACGAPEEPADRWLSAAEALEFLPGPVVIGGRIEIPRAGFSIEVPDGWLAADLSHPDVVPRLRSVGQSGSWLADALDGQLGASFDDRVARGHEMVLWTSSAAEGPENHQHCEAYILKTPLTSIGQFLELNSTYFDGDQSQTWEQVDLPAGPAARNDYRWSATAFGTDYTLFDGRRFVTLSCVQGLPVDDVGEAARRESWRSIADTFEFLDRHQ